MTPMKGQKRGLLMAGINLSNIDFDSWSEPDYSLNDCIQQSANQAYLERHSSLIEVTLLFAGRFYDLKDGVGHQFRLVALDTVSALPGDHVDSN